MSKTAKAYFVSLTSQSDGYRLGKSMTHGISLICTMGFKSPPLVLWAKLIN